MQGLLDQLLGDERAVGVGGVDEVDAELDRAAQHADGLVGVGGVAPDAGAGQLHRAVAEPVDGQLAAEVEGAGGARGAVWVVAHPPTLGAADAGRTRGLATSTGQ